VIRSRKFLVVTRGQAAMKVRGGTKTRLDGSVPNYVTILCAGTRSNKGIDMLIAAREFAVEMRSVFSTGCLSRLLNIITKN
jgi:hypothetical protein